MTIESKEKPHASSLLVGKEAKSKFFRLHGKQEQNQRAMAKE